MARQFCFWVWTQYPISNKNLDLFYSCTPTFNPGQDMPTQNVPRDCKNLSSEMNSNNVVKHVITLDKPTKIQVVKALQIAHAPIQRRPPITPRKCFFFLHKEVGLFCINLWGYFAQIFLTKYSRYEIGSQFNNCNFENNKEQNNCFL